MLTLRRAAPSDADAAARLIGSTLAEYGLSFEPGGRDADVAAFGSRSDHDDLVVEGEDGVLGVASVGSQGDEGVAWISKVFVARAARRRGIGRSLLEAAHAAARARGYREVGLRTRLVFEEAIALYESSGYVRRGEPTGGDVVYHRAL